MDNNIKNYREQEVAEILDVSVITLRCWRHERRGPPYLKISNRCVRYPDDELNKWIKNKNNEITNKPIDAFNHAVDAVRYVALNKLMVSYSGKYYIS